MLNLMEIQEKISQLDNWNIEFNSIIKDFKFTNFTEAKSFIDKISQISEQQAHFPTITWNNLIIRINLSTASKNAITEADFTLAKEIDKIYKR
ncbi:MAG: 4a-hydroxytetrahydrobiopterin dehydratase [archaeon]|nr:4a-hydroxytetrahydrobiopterin dehydratase [archaeon]